jgi:DNA-binding SARP family transcriptional activator/WD40 repeat protein
MSGLTVRVLGPVEVLADGHHLRLDSPKQRSLLAFLSIHVGEVQSADRIIDALWGEEPPQGGAKTLRYHVSKLRAALGDGGDFVMTSSPGYVLAVPPEAIDSHCFETLLTQAQTRLSADPARASRLFDEALGLWRGAAFSDFQYEEFVQAEARRLEELRLIALEDQGRAALAAGRHRDLVGEFGALVAEHPRRERMLAVLMVALYRTGRHADALHEYDRFRKQLVEQSGLDPSVELATLMERVLCQDPALTSGDPFGETSVAVAPLEVRNPFKGLRPFTEVDAADFFGRSDLVARMTERLGEPGLSGRLLVVAGPSGSGKSSLVRAGLVPVLRQGGVAGSQQWRITTMYPGFDPIGRLTEILTMNDATEPHLLIIDQFEELFVLTDPDTHATFLGMVEELVTGTQPIRIVCTLRADFIDRPLSYPSFAPMVEAGLMLVTPLLDDDVRDAVVEPAELVGVRVEPELAAAMISDVAPRAAILPLLQYTLTELFEHRRGDTLTLDAYRAAGGIAGALARRANHTYLELDAVQREAARQVFLHLVTVTSDAEHLRRRVTVQELTEMPIDTPSLEHVLDRFGKQRLLTFDRDPDSAHPTVEVAHEALLREWPRLWDWVESSREDIRTDQLLAAAVTEWVEADRDPGFLPAGSRLSRLQDWAETTTLALTAGENDYLNAATRLAAELHRRAARRRRLLTATFAAAAAIAIILAVVALVQRNRAQDQAAVVEQQMRVAAARELAGDAHGVMSEDPELAMLLSLVAIDIGRDAGETAAGDAIGSLHEAVLASLWKEALPGAGEVAWSPDGSRLLTKDPSSPLEKGIIIDLATGETALELPGMLEAGSVAWSGNGRLVATGDDRGPTILWEAATGKRLPPLPETMRYQWGLTFSPDGAFLAGRNMLDYSVTVINTATAAVVERIETDGEGWGIAFRPDSDVIATVSWDEADLWDEGDTIELRAVPDSGEVAVIRPAPSVRWIEFSPDGRHLAGVSTDGTLYIWDADTLRELKSIPQAGDGKPAWSPDGSTIALASGDHAVVWNTATVQQEPFVNAHPSTVTAVSYSPDGRTLATADAQRVRLWDVLHLQGEIAAFPGSWKAVDWLPDGARLVAFDSGDRFVHLLDVRTNELLATLADELNAVERVVASPDGRFVAIADAVFQRVLVLDPATQQIVKSLPAGTPLAFDPDTSRLVVGNVFGNLGISIYDTRTWQEVLHLDVGSLAAAFLPDGRHLLVSTQPGQGTTGGEGAIWDLSVGAEIARLPLPGRGAPGGVSVSADGGLITVAEAETGYIGVWRTDALLTGANPDEALVQEIVGPPGLRDAQVSRDGASVFTVAGSTFFAFDVTTGEWAHDIDMGAAIPGFSLSPDGRHVAIPSENGLDIITMDLDELIEVANYRIGRDLTDDECRSYLNIEACPVG